MPLTVPSTALRHMTEEERTRLLDEAFAAAPDALTNYLAVIEARLRAFEQRYELASSELAEALRRGAVRDTADVSDWLFWVGVWSRLAREARP
jgi:hypothetical protein